MNIVHITDHAARSLARLPEQYKDKANLIALFTAHAAQWQDLEDVGYAVYILGSLSGDSGIALDQIGSIVGHPRGGLIDSPYRVRLAAKIAQNVSKGTGPDLIRIYKLITQASRVQFLNVFPASCALTAFNPITVSTSVDVENALKSSTEAGVRIDYLSLATDPAFSFFEDPDVLGLGFGDASDSTVGGFLATLFGEDVIFSFFEDSDPAGSGFGDINDASQGGFLASAS